MSLYQKYRPKSLEKVKGNANLISTLDTMLGKPNPPHAYFLYGPTGCGKTTIARIIASRLGCNGTDLREIDTADFRGIDTVREIRKNSQYMAIQSSCCVWIVDECHKMTGDAQNALLKILEDPPTHVYFILCTTDPQKVITTVQGRCSKFQVSLLDDEEMLSVLKRIVKLEKETLDEKIYETIIRDSLGHARNAINILEQVLSVKPEKRNEVAQRAAIEQSQTIELCRALMNPRTNWKQVAVILKGLKGQEPEGIRQAVLGYTQNTLLNNDMPLCGLILEEFMSPFYDSGYSRLVYACYSIIKNK